MSFSSLALNSIQLIVSSQRLIFAFFYCRHLTAVCLGPFPLKIEDTAVDKPQHVVDVRLTEGESRDLHQDTSPLQPDSFIFEDNLDLLTEQQNMRYEQLQEAPESQGKLGPGSALPTLDSDTTLSSFNDVDGNGGGENLGNVYANMPHPPYALGHPESSDPGFKTPDWVYAPDLFGVWATQPERLDQVVVVEDDQ